MIKFEKVDTCKAIINHMGNIEINKYDEIFEKNHMKKHGKNNRSNINNENEKNENIEFITLNNDNIIPILKEKSLQNVLRKVCIMFASKREWTEVNMYIYIYLKTVFAELQS
jgi:hypothetical protein